MTDNGWGGWEALYRVWMVAALVGLFVMLLEVHQKLNRILELVEQGQRRAYEPIGMSAAMSGCT